MKYYLLYLECDYQLLWLLLIERYQHQLIFGMIINDFLLSLPISLVVNCQTVIDYQVFSFNADANPIEHESRINR